MRAALLLTILLPTVARADDLLTLERAIQLARAQHPTVDAQRAQAAITRARVQQATAGLLPFITGSFAYQPQTPNYAPSPAQRRAIARGVDTVLNANGQPVTVSCAAVGTDSCVP